jgi:hypothetical protein
MPLSHRQLSGNQGRFAAISFFEDFQEVEALLVIESVGAPVIQNEQLDSRELVDEAREATVETGDAQVFEQAGHPQIENGMIEPSGLASEGAPQPGFAGSGLTGDDKIFS